MKPRHPLVPAQMRLERYRKCLVLNSRGELYANPGALLDLESTTARPTDWLLFDEYEPNVIALHWQKTQVEGAVHVRRPKSRNTALFGAGPILILSPALKPQASGYVRELPYRMEPHGTYPLFLLDIRHPADPRLGDRKGRRSGKNKKKNADPTG